MDILALAKQEEEAIIRDRRYLHEHPEVSRQEENTVAFIKQRLETLGISYVEVPKGGILAFLGAEDAQKTVLLRADIDALPIEENPCNLKQKKTCVSKVPGVGHLCGHDGHTAMLLAAGKILQEHKEELPGRVILMFERAEEAGGNLLYLLRYLYENKIKIDGGFGMHVNPNVPAGKMSLDFGSITSGGYGFEMLLHGRGGHGSAPDKANSPIDCFVAIYQAVTQIPVKYVSAKEVCAFNIGRVISGSKRNIIPETLDFAGGFRFYKKSVGDTVIKRFLRQVEEICHVYDCTHEVTYAIGPTLPIENNKQCVEIGRRAIEQHLGAERRVDYGMESFSETFSNAMQFFPGAYGMLGIGNEALGSGAMNHDPQFDLDESVLYLGTAWHVAFAMEFLKNETAIDFTPYAGSPDQLYDDMNYKVE